MNHFAAPEFWPLYHALPLEVRALADKNYALLKQVYILARAASCRRSQAFTFSFPTHLPTRAPKFNSKLQP